MELEAVAVELDLMHPALRARRLFHERGERRIDEGRKRPANGGFELAGLNRRFVDLNVLPLGLRECSASHVRSSSGEKRRSQS
jgi:hypothetical protein